MLAINANLGRQTHTNRNPIYIGHLDSDICALVGIVLCNYEGE